MEVSVSPRATMWDPPPGRGVSTDAGAAAGSGRGCAFPNHYSRAHIGNLLLQFQNLLRKHIDLGVLFVDLLRQLFQLRCRRRIFRGASKRLGNGGRRRQSAQADSNSYREN